MSEHRYPRRFKSSGIDYMGGGYIECQNPGGPLVWNPKNHNDCTRWNAGLAPESDADEAIAKGIWIETYDHHDKDTDGMYQHFSAAGPSPANSEVANLRAEVERLAKERDVIANRLECEKASSAHRWELVTKYAGFVGKIREGLGNEASCLNSCKLPEFAESLRKERDELRAKLAESEAAAAKMREAIIGSVEFTKEVGIKCYWLSPLSHLEAIVKYGVGSHQIGNAETHRAFAKDAAKKLGDAVGLSAGREFLAERDAMKTEISALKSQLESQRLIREAERRFLGDRDIPKEMLELLVRCAFACGEISHGRAAELMGCSVQDWREKMANAGVIQGDGLESTFSEAIERLTRDNEAYVKQIEALAADNLRLEKRLAEEKESAREAEEDRAATHAKLSQMTGRLEVCRKNYELCDKDRLNAEGEKLALRDKVAILGSEVEKLTDEIGQLVADNRRLEAKLKEEKEFSQVYSHRCTQAESRCKLLEDFIEGPNGWKATCEVQRQTIAAYENGLTTPLSMPERSAYESRANEYRAELQRQLNEAWMRQAFNDADRIADLLGVQRPSDHEKEDLKPAAPSREWVKKMADGEDQAASVSVGGLAADLQPASEWPEVWERRDEPGQTVTLNGPEDQQSSVRPDGSLGVEWSRSELIGGLTKYKLISKGGKPVKEVE